MSRKEKIGIFGGTFNPPHIGHIGAAEAFASSIKPDKLLIMPDFLPPHKILDADVEPEDRLNMCRLAFLHIPNASVSELEMNRGGKSYTALTLQELAADDRELYFLCGTDMFLTLEKWYSFKTIFELAVICCVRREEDAENSKIIEETARKYKDEYNARIISIQTSVIEVSSSELREFLRGGSGAESFLTESVYEYIKEKGLYR